MLIYKFRIEHLFMCTVCEWEGGSLTRRKAEGSTWAGHAGILGGRGGVSIYIYIDMHDYILHFTSTLQSGPKS